MNHAHRLLAVALLLTPMTAHASPAEAARIRQAWEGEMEKWVRETRAATTPDARAAALEKQPDTIKALRGMWRQIGPALDQPWVLEHVAWFLRVAPGHFQTGENGAREQVFGQELLAILKALDAHHVASDGMAPVCMALAGNADPRTLPLLEKILASHPDPKTQGVAALSAAIVLRSLGDEPELMRKRLTYLRKSIIDSSDVRVTGDSTVARVAEDELYVIRFLSKGRVAPDLEGADSAGRPIKLSDHAGRIVVLVFWSDHMNDAEHAIRIMNDMHARFQSRPVTVLGVNRDPLDKLREMEGSGTVAWRSISDPENKLARTYRVGVWPLVHVLDGERRIQYTGSPGSFVELTVEALLSESSDTPDE
ncbi:MAG TPA: redoxin domain-containing protein [Luteolibacter sp.]|nr:redoxin domain-containing protein [Luteolibacter sp.]